MTLEEALRFIDPETDMDALAEVEYYNGFKGKEAAAKTLREASQMVVDFVRRVSWHDAKTPPPVHDESWENAGEKHCCIMSELVWVCCESRNTMKGWIENGKWYIEDGRPAADTPYGAVKFWAPLLEPPHMKNTMPGCAFGSWLRQSRASTSCAVQIWRHPRASAMPQSTPSNSPSET